MTVSNEDLLMEMHRVGALMRRAHHGGHPHAHGHGHGHAVPHAHGEGGPRCSHAHGASGLPEGHPPVHGHGVELPEGHPPIHGHGHGVVLPEGHPPIHGHGGHHHGHGGKCTHKGSGKHGQARILAMLEVQDGMSQKDLAFLLGIRPQSLTVALEKLESEGLIERKQDEGDKRTRRVFITDAGKEKAASQAEERSKQADDVFAVLSEEEKEQLSSILSKLATSLDKGSPSAGDPEVQQEK
ncbi:MAG: MarR family transcriptional regulator [Eggerthellaceae bacterium]|nr:MarR family transcriptional regulator [Eggerthellaceae bacterium]